MEPKPKKSTPVKKVVAKTIEAKTGKSAKKKSQKSSELHAEKINTESSATFEKLAFSETVRKRWSDISSKLFPNSQPNPGTLASYWESQEVLVCFKHIIGKHGMGVQKLAYRATNNRGGFKLVGVRPFTQEDLKWLQGYTNKKIVLDEHNSTYRWKVGEKVWFNKPASHSPVIAFITKVTAEGVEFKELGESKTEKYDHDVAGYYLQPYVYTSWDSLLH